MNAPLIPGATYREFVEAAMGCRTEDEFRKSRFFAVHGVAIERLLSTPQIRTCTHGERRAPAQGRDRLRVVHWNIEKGKQLERIIRRLTEDPYLADADVYCLNEVDVGMARSGNVDVASVLAEALHCDFVFVPSYLECTKGPDEEAFAPGENTRGLHGLAILSRHEIQRAEVVPLPHCFDYFAFFEKRFGRRQVLIAQISWGSTPLVVATTHLEVRNTPECRAMQLSPLPPALDAFRRAGSSRAPCVLTGDFNTNSFRRGSFANAAREFMRIVSMPAERLDAELAAPYEREPVFELLERAGFDYLSFTDGRPTASQVLGGAEDLKLLPGPARELVSRTCGLGKRVLRMRLDWIATAGLVSAGPPETHESTISGSEPASDHALLSAEVALPS